MPDQQPRGSVTERLSARLDALEPVVQRLLANEAKLIADAVTMDQRVKLLVDYATGLQADMRQSERSLRLAQGATFNSLVEFCGRSRWQRLRWLLTGR